MRIEADQHFTLPHPGPHAAALAFLRDPALALSRLDFLHSLRVEHAPDGVLVRATLLVPVPMLGQVDLPLVSRLVPEAGGARLEALMLPGERAWIELWGEGRVLPGEPGHPDPDRHPGTGAQGGAALDYTFRFVAHLDVPQAEQWGGAAFEKMVGAAARRTLERLTRELPQGIGAALATGTADPST